MATSNIRPHPKVQNFHLVWLDRNIDEINDDDCRNSITKLRQVVNTVNTFVDADECINFINSIKDEKAFMISSGAFGEKTVPLVHDKTQVNRIYIFCQNKAHHQKWAKAWPKVKGVFTDIDPICKALKEAVHDCDQNSVSISFVKKTSGGGSGAVKQNLDTLDSSFMYTQILKEILLTIDFEKSHINEFLAYCREQFIDNNAELRNIDMIAKGYQRHKPIWWYTYECFLYSMLNRALRTMEVDLIIKMGFFLKDLHNHIVALHREQYGGHQHLNSFTVYRGQGLSQTDFDELKQTQGGLLSFNNFLSTSKSVEIPLEFARRTMNISNLVSVLFVIEIDPTITATPFANVKYDSYYYGEEEILFSMHSIFRIGQIKQIDENNRLWQVDLTLTSDNDPELLSLTKRIQEETKGSTGWFRLGKLMIKLAEYGKAENLYTMLLSITTNEREKGDIYYQLGLIMFYRGEYTNALSIYEKSLRLRTKVLSLEHPDVADCYNDIGLIYDSISEYSKALSSHEKALDIYQKTLPLNHPSLATSYNNIALVYDKTRDYSKALSHYERALEIYQKTLAINHPLLATAYNNIGLVYDKIGEYSKALSSHEKALEIREKSLPTNHPDLANSYNNIGWVYRDMTDYKQALLYYERALDIWQRSFPSYHPDIRDVNESIEIVKKKL